MKVQFIFPNIGCPIGIHMGIAVLSAELKKAGHETNCIHLNEALGYPYDLERVLKDIENYGPDLIAFSFGTNHIIEVKEIAGHIKQRFQLPIIFGGIHPTLNAREMISLDYVDMVGVGDGEEAIVDLANALEKGENYTSIRNIWVKKDGKIYENRIRPLRDVTDQILMDTEIFDFQRITDLRLGWVNMIAARGCAFGCTYCHNNGVIALFKKELNTSSYKKLNYRRQRSVDNLINECKLMNQKYNATAFSFIDDVFTQSKSWTIEFAKKYKEEVGMPFVINTSAAFMDQDIADALAAAKCDLVRFGLECGSERIRKEILGRKVSQNQLNNALSAVRKAGIRNFTYNMMGVPTETKENMLSTLELNAKLMPDGLRVSLLYPYPGTEIYDLCSKMDIIEDVEYHDYLEDTKLKWPDRMKLFIDKTRLVYWWHINKHLNNGASKVYDTLLKIVEDIPEDEWWKDDTQSKLLNVDKTMSELMSKLNITHYVAKYEHRPDISILVQGDDFLPEELLDDH